MSIQRAYRYFIDGEWVITVLFIETIALSVAEAADVLPDGNLKNGILIGSQAVVAFVARARVWSKRTATQIQEGKVRVA